MTRTIPSCESENPSGPECARHTCHVLRNRTRTSIRVPAGHGMAFLVKQDRAFRVIDLHGSQVVDMMVWACDSSQPPPVLSPEVPEPDRISLATTFPHPLSHSLPPDLRLPQLPAEHLSTTHTLSFFNSPGHAPRRGECLYSNRGAELLRLERDDSGVHDLTFAACYPGLYRRYGAGGHRSCAGNFVEALERLGFDLSAGAGAGGRGGGVETRQLALHPPFNTFQNTPGYDVRGRPGGSRKGDVIEWRNVSGRSCVVGVSCCPWEFDGFNGGNVTDIAVEMDDGLGSP